MIIILVCKQHVTTAVRVQFCWFGMEFVENQGDGDNIWCAASDGDIARVTSLLAQNINVNAQDEAGYSPMYD